MRILFIVPYIPSLIRVRSYNLIRTLASLGHDVHLVALQPPEDRYASVEKLRDFCAQVDVFRLSRGRTLWNAATALPGALPLQAAYSHQPQAIRHLRQLVDSGRFDVVHVEHLRGAVLAEGLNGVPRIFDSVDSIAYLFDQAARLAPKPTQRLLARLDLGRTRLFEASAPFRYDRVLVTSPVDAQAIKELAGGRAQDRIALLPNGVDLNYFRPSESPRDPATILFSGKMSYHANAAAALHLGREIMPRILQERPDAALMIVGKDPTPAVRALSADPRITVTGFVDDVRPYFARATIAVSPLLYGAGMQNKVLEAMSCGAPVVVTPRVVCGLRAQPGRDLLVGEEPDDFASNALRLLNDPDLHADISRAGRRYVEEHHAWPEIVKILIGIYSSCRAQARL